MKITIILCVIILFSESDHSLHAQSQSDRFKNAAIVNMESGRYGEAIDLLNKFISANPQNPDGYYLRGMCYESQGQYEYSVYDLRSAQKINQSDKKISNALNRVTDVWYTQLYNKIEGHKREIALMPQKAINYLEIGKCFKNLGKWDQAEEWYDKYLVLEEPSSDEVIRYTEILAKNNHITKGEKILKVFVEKYPEDHRLWSRYGYFTFWLGKRKIAIDAFSEALKFRPFFKEAIDGLNLAKGKGSIYTVNDTSYRYNKLTGTFQKRKAREYPIDSYFRILRRNPENDSLRIELINELVKVNRLEEAKQQLILLDKKNINESTYSLLSNKISQKFKEYYESKIENIKSKIKSNPNDRKSVLELAGYYSYNNDIDSVKIVYSKYLFLNPDDNDVRYDYARKLSWVKQFDDAKAQLNILLEKKPNQLEYLLLRGQIAVWTNENSKIASDFLKRVLEKDAKNTQALTGLAVINYQTKNFTDAEELIAQIEKIDPNDPNLTELKFNLNIQKKQAEEDENFSILQTARNALSEEKCKTAVEKFKEYLDKVKDNKQISHELANAYICSNDYKNAINVYSNLIGEKYDYDLVKQRAKWYFWSGDSLNALREFKSLYAANPGDTEVKLFLGDSYFNMRDYRNAEKIYTELLSQAPSSILLNNRLSWLPEGEAASNSFSSFISNFPSYTLITPEAYYFKDNLSFKYNMQGIRTELGFPKFISLGGSIFRGDVSSDSTRENFYTVIGTLLIIPSKYFTASFSFGETKYIDSLRHSVSEVTLKTESKGKYSLIARYSARDAAQILYSPFIVGSDLRVTDYSLEGTYYTPKQILLSGSYSFKKVTDDNKSKELTLRIGRKFSDDFISGYEYYNLSYDFETPLYYSPGNFESHSLWGDYKIIQDDLMDLSVGGKIGLVPNSDLLIKEFNSRLSLKLFDSFTLQANAVFGENARENVFYRSTSVSINAFWVF